MRTTKGPEGRKAKKRAVALPADRGLTLSRDEILELVREAIAEVLPIPLDPNQRYSLAEAAKLLRISRTSLWAKIRRKELKTFPDGSRKYITGAELLRASAPPAAP